MQMRRGLVAALVGGLLFAGACGSHQVSAEEQAANNVIRAFRKANGQAPWARRIKDVSYRQSDRLFEYKNVIVVRTDIEWSGTDAPPEATSICQAMVDATPNKDKLTVQVAGPHIGKGSTRLDGSKAPGKVKEYVMVEYWHSSPHCKSVGRQTEIGESL
jgi:hypothetical protein